MVSGSSSTHASMESHVHSPSFPDSLASEAWWMGARQLLEADSRPSFVLDRANLSNTSPRCTKPVYQNPAFYSIPHLRRLLFPDDPHGASSTSFSQWLHNLASNPTNSRSDACPRTSYPHNNIDLDWHHYEVLGRWLVFSGSTFASTTDPPRSVVKVPLARNDLDAEDRWRKLLRLVDDPTHIKTWRKVEWHKTSLGAPDLWPESLWHMLAVLLLDPSPAILFFGDDLTIIYNEPYVPTMLGRHPAILGMRPAEAWPDAYDDKQEHIFRQVRTTARPMKIEDAPFLLNLQTDTGVETHERYFSYTLMPKLDDSGEVECIYDAVRETTLEVISKRRLRILIEMSNATGHVVKLADYWTQLLATLEASPMEFAGALLYINKSRPDTLALHGTIGIPDASTVVPKIVSLAEPDEVLAALCIEALQHREPMVLNKNSGRVPECFSGLLERRGYGEHCDSVAILPLRPSNAEASKGILILGLSPWQQFDNDYKQFIDLVGRQLASSLASIVSYEDELRKGQAHVEQARKRARQLEDRFTQITNLSPAGIFVCDMDGKVVYSNQRHRELTQMKPDSESMDWTKIVLEEDLEDSLKLFGALTAERQSISSEIRLKTPWLDPGSTPTNPVYHPTTVLVEAYPEFDENGDMVSFAGCVTDISQQKWAESQSAKKAEEALESKRALESFIDITCHEIRNPLNAILQCADDIVQSMTHRREGMSDNEIAENTISAAETIVYCAQHQKHIVDDILTASKLDFNLITISPVDVQPLAMTRQMIGMFSPQAEQADIALSLEVQPSLQSLDVDWLLLDPSRVLQILTNLITNAIRSTQNCAERTVRVSIAAHLAPPRGSVHDQSIVYFPSIANFPVQVTPRSHVRPAGPSSDTATEGDYVYLQFQVADTGRGVSAAEVDKLFANFKEHDHKTTTNFHNTGMGLRVCQELAELHGGSVGLSLVPAPGFANGCLFSFYIRAQRSQGPRRISLQRNQSESTGPPRVAVHAPSGPDTLVRRNSTRVDTCDLSAASILVVEDNLVNQKVLCRQLVKLGCTVTVANHGGEALDFLATTMWHSGVDGRGSKPLTCILLDSEMPVMNGLTCIRTIRHWQREGRIIGHVPVIGVTANARMEQIQDAKAAGMDDVVSKPYRVAELVRTVERTLRRLANGDSDGDFDGAADARQGRTAHEALRQLDCDVIMPSPGLVEHGAEAGGLDARGIIGSLSGAERLGV